MPREHVLHSVPHSGLICNSWKLETTQMSLNQKVHTENVIHLHNEILFGY